MAPEPSETAEDRQADNIVGQERDSSFPEGGGSRSVPPAPAPSAPVAPEKPKEPPVAVDPLDAETAKKHQQASADDLGVAVEITNSIGMKLVLIPAGEFMMGSRESPEETCEQFGMPSGLARYFKSEHPQHRVRITKPFYLGVYEVAQAEYERVMGENPSSLKGAVNPVESLSWDDAVEFCKRLSAKEGRTYHLPTEAQWEYACRAGTATRYSSGDDPASLGAYAWYRENSDNTRPVGEKKPSAWGLHDMHGNVREWCQDWFGADYYANSPVTDPQGPTQSGNRVYRGGGWDYRAENCRSANRGRFEPEGRNNVLGFRVALRLSGN